MAKRKINNYNAMRPALVASHNLGNKHALTAQEVACAGVQNLQFEAWKQDVNALRMVVAEYVTLKKNSRFDSSITEEMLTKAYNKIYPKWKEVLGAGEKSKVTKELRVNPRDVEDLVGFVWTFTVTSNGTVEAIVGEQVFRRKVEALVGCAIAKNAVLSDEDREINDKYRGAVKSLATAEDKIAEIEAIIKVRKEDIEEHKDNEDFRDFLEKLLEADKATLKDAETRKQNAEAEIRRLEKRAQAIDAKVKRAK